METYLGGRELREEAVKGSVEFVLLESGGNSKKWWEGSFLEERLRKKLGAEKQKWGGVGFLVLQTEGKEKQTKRGFTLGNWNI